MTVSPALPPIRNIAIIAHVDHGKTTLVDQLLKQSGTFAQHQAVGERILDSNDLDEGMIIGIHNRENDLVVNPVRTKQLTNIRAAGSDEAVRLTPPIELTLERAVEFIDDDELVEITPKSIRLRKRLLKEHERRKAARQEE